MPFLSLTPQGLMNAPSTVWRFQGLCRNLAFGVICLLLAAAASAQNATPTGLPDAASERLESSANDEHSDPVTRFLSDKGLLDTRPVTELASQMRDKASDLASDLVISAMDFLGVPYRRGGQSKDAGFDCSGFTRHVFERSIGMVLPRRAAEQASMPGMMSVNKAELKPGDLVFFNTLRHTFSHVGIYIGDNKFIHSPRAGGSVRIEDMRLAYWQQRFDGARRVPTLSKSPLNTSAQVDSAP
ncbi:MAG TPA: C40 family peptidase [Aquabacterium sp.]|uniref:C40 family peptidase n=1 Tax=Aquabacterium sp. TaxID=1872578 RepID=UPI002E30CC83|nr:C40 family peptidase [Aquabacterium sp.]HEX5372232.1 C40 family peptidase [Aquabacterium sp.]